MILRQINGCSAGTCPSGGRSRIEPLPFCVSSCADLRSLLFSYSVIVELYIAATGNVCGGNATVFVHSTRTCASAYANRLFITRVFPNMPAPWRGEKNFATSGETARMINRSAQSICRLYLPPLPSPPATPSLTPPTPPPPRASAVIYFAISEARLERPPSPSPSSISLGSFINLRHLECLFSHFPLPPPLPRLFLFLNATRMRAQLLRALSVLSRCT